MPENARGVGQARSGLGFFHEGGNLVCPDRSGDFTAVDLDDAKLVSHGQRLAYGSHGCPGPGVDVALHHLFKVHAIDVVGAHHHNDVRLGVDNEVH